MATLGIRTGGYLSGRVNFRRSNVHPGRLPSKVTMCSLPSHSTQLKESSSGGRAQTHVGGPEKFDRWMKDSVAEIVKNLEEAPLFVHVYGGDRSTTRVKTEKAVEEDWSCMKNKWVKGEEASPEGIILVEEINVDEEDKEGKMGIMEEEEGQNGEGTKAWGVVIQGKGEDGGVACYLLKTSKAGGGSSLGLFCTHYCLVRVKSFRETARSQLRNCWLV